MMHHVPQANAGQAHKDSTVYSGEQNSESDDGHASQIQYVEAKRISIPKAPGMPKEWYAIAHEANPEQFEHWDENKWPAKLCFVQENGKTEQKCFEAVATGRSLGPCQYVGELSVVPIFKHKYPQTGVLFLSISSYGGSGALHLMTLWVFDENAKEFANILPEITFSELGEYKILQGVGDALDGTLVVADWTYEEGEGHFSPHKYRITIYQYDQTDKRFELRGEYCTKTKYAEEPVNVISQEIENIQESILSKK